MRAIKKYWWAVAALLGAVLALFKGRNPWMNRAEKVAAEASAATHDLIDAQADAEKAVNQNESDQAHAELANLSDADLFADALQRERAKRGGS